MTEKATICYYYYMFTNLTELSVVELAKKLCQYVHFQY